jgi:hypothetical protein
VHSGHDNITNYGNFNCADDEIMVNPTIVI